MVNWDAENTEKNDDGETEKEKVEEAEVGSLRDWELKSRVSRGNAQLLILPDYALKNLYQNKPPLQKVTADKSALYKEQPYFVFICNIINNHINPINPEIM